MATTTRWTTTPTVRTCRTIGDATNLLAVRAHEKGLELVCDIDPPVPFQLVGDPTRLRQVLVNLVGNAVKFTSEGEVVVRVTFEPVDEARAYLHVTVRDTGIGIPEEKQKSIFQPFHQADTSTTRRFGGTGLGLAISAELARQMHGRLWVESQPGHGSSFHFTGLLGSVGAEGPDADERSRLVGHRILVVDDNRTARTAIARQLAADGARSAMAHDSETTLHAVERATNKGAPYDLLLIDADLDGEDGFAVAERARGKGDAVIPVIMLVTALERTRTARRCRDLGVSSVRKPVRAADLRSTVIAAISGETIEVDPDEDTSSPHGHAALRVLLAEDNAVNQRVARALLERIGHAVEIVDDGAAAVAQVAASTFDLVLMDLQMPVMGGLEATRRIRESTEEGTPRIPIIAMTAHALPEDRERCMDAGMDGFVTKPIEVRDLATEIARLLPQVAATIEAPISERSADSDAFDRAAVLERLGGDAALLDELADLLLREFVQQRATILGALESEDFDAIAAAAHALKGSIGNFGARSAQQSAEDLEIAAGEGDVVRCRSETDRLTTEVDRLLGALGRSRS